MLNRIWLTLVISGIVSVFAQVIFGFGEASFSAVMDGLYDMTKTSVTIALGLIGVMAFWLGIFEIATHSGATNLLARVTAPLLHRLMPEVPKEHPAFGSITMNIGANILGLDNAATPLGIKAIQDLQSLNPKKEMITDAQLMFLVLNTSSLTLFPITVFLYRAEQGAMNPTDVFVPILLATLASSLVGLLVVAYRQGINLLNRAVALYGVALIAIVASIVIYFAGLAANEMAEMSAVLANGILLAFILVVLILSHRRGLDSFDLFITGAKNGFTVAVNLIPYLLAMLVAIAIFRTSGLLDIVLNGISSVVSVLGFDTRFVDALPTAIMKPLSGSGARAMMIETMQTHGVDSFAARMAAVMQGSTETTFYVIAVYLGAVRISRIRYLVSSCLLADFAGILTAVLVSYWFFG